MLKNYPIARLAVYGIAVLSMAVSFFATTLEWPIAPAFVQTANLLGAVAGVGAISNLGTLSRRPGDLAADPDFVDDEIPLGFGDESSELTPVEPATVAATAPHETSTARAHAPAPRHAKRE